MGKKTRKGFDDITTIVALVCFGALGLWAFTPFNVADWLLGLIAIIAGAGLMLEGRIMTIKKWASDGINKDEAVYAFTIIFGLITLIGGFLSLPLFEIYVNTGFKTVMGIVAIGSAILIALQRWYWN